MFTDQITLKLSAGKGGNGVIAWRREKFIPKGGPCGGDGGKGGDIVFEADPQILSLEHFCHQRILKAENGVQGASSNRQGRKGKDLVLKVPVGTIVKEASSKKILKDLVHPLETFCICKGGLGGKGNTHFKSATQRAPYVCTEGTQGQAIEVELELKLIADIGLIGMPNAGKSTLFSALTSIKNVKVAAYPFTTLTPNLALLEFEDYSRLYLADIPGIIEDASKNRGLGLAFLRHIERTSVLIYVIDGAGSEGRDPIEDFSVLQQELFLHNPQLKAKPFIIALNKMDLKEGSSFAKKFKKNFPQYHDVIFELSALLQSNLEAFCEKIKVLAQTCGKKYT